MSAPDASESARREVRGGEVQVLLTDVSVQDTVIVRPREMFSVARQVIEGQATVNQAAHRG